MPFVFPAKRNLFSRPGIIRVFKDKLECIEKHTHIRCLIVLPWTPPPSTRRPLLSRGTYLVSTQTSRWEPHTDRPHTQRVQTHTLKHILPTEQLKYTQLEFCLHTRTHIQLSVIPLSPLHCRLWACVCFLFPLIKTEVRVWLYKALFFPLI